MLSTILIFIILINTKKPRFTRFTRLFYFRITLFRIISGNENNEIGCGGWN